MQASGAQAGYLYLAVVIDLWSRKVVGWSMRSDLTTPLVTDALDMAISQRKTLGWKTPAETLDEHLHSLKQGSVATTP